MLEKLQRSETIVQWFKSSVQNTIDQMVANSDARERELQQRIQKLEYNLRARPLVEDGWTRDPAGDAGPGLLQGARDALAQLVFNLIYQFGIKQTIDIYIYIYI